MTKKREYINGQLRQRPSFEDALYALGASETTVSWVRQRLGKRMALAAWGSFLRHEKVQVWDALKLPLDTDFYQVRDRMIDVLCDDAEYGKVLQDFQFLFEGRGEPGGPDRGPQPVR